MMCVVGNSSELIITTTTDVIIVVSITISFKKTMPLLS